MKKLISIVGVALIAGVACKKETPPATDARAGEQRRASDAPRVVPPPVVTTPTAVPGDPNAARPPVAALEPEQAVTSPEPDLGGKNDLSTPEGLAHAYWRAYKKKDVDAFKGLVVTEGDIAKMLLPEKSEVPKREIAKLPDKFKKVLEIFADVKWKGLKIGKPQKLSQDRGFKEESEGIRRTLIFVERDGKPDRMGVRAMLKCEGKWKIASL
ncbi:MAG: hypothetical protein HYY84_18685 [Deltaproteobacteria bacterium]|nr:hypothetical protein [Deltaproteobacteria bacterium]